MKVLLLISIFFYRFIFFYTILRTWLWTIFFLRFKKNLEDWIDTHKDHICFLLYQHLPSFCILFYVCVYVTANVIKLVIMHISRLVCIMSSPIEKSDEKRILHQIFRLFCIIFMLNGEFEYQIDYLSQ